MTEYGWCTGCDWLMPKAEGTVCRRCRARLKAMNLLGTYGCLLANDPEREARLRLYAERAARGEPVCDDRKAG